MENDVEAALRTIYEYCKAHDNCYTCPFSRPYGTHDNICLFDATGNPREWAEHFDTFA